MEKTPFSSLSSAELIKHLYKRKVLLFGLPFALAVIVALFSLTIDNRYTSVANLIPSQRPSLGLDLFSDGGGLSSLASSVLGGGTNDEANRYLILLTSNTTSRRVIDQFNLVEHYDLTESKYPIQFATDLLASRTTFESKEEGNFVIAVEDKSPELAKEIADFYIQILNEENTRVISGDAKNYRQFIEERVATANNDLDSLRNRILEFQNEFGIVEFPEQASQYISIIGALSAKEIEAKIKLDILSETLQPSNDIYRSAEIELNSISKRLSEIYSNEDTNDLFLNFNQLPEVGSEYLNLMLEVEIQAEIQKFLVPLYEQAKMEEAKSLPIVSIIDAPRIPEIKSFPRRSLITIAAGISAFILILLYLVIEANFSKNKTFFTSLIE